MFGDASYRLYEPHELREDGYPFAWDVIKREVREDAGNRCVRCRHPFTTGETPGEWSPCDEECSHPGPLRVVYANGSIDELGARDARTGVQVIHWLSETGRLEPAAHVEAHWRILTTHHLDGNKANCRWWNLAPLCQRCHLHIQLKVHMSRRWLHEHTPWFRPYVAAYYAFVYLGQDLARAQTLERLEELLDLEHRQEALI